mgnify:CR=1 FL=1
MKLYPVLVLLSADDIAAIEQQVNLFRATARSEDLDALDAVASTNGWPTDSLHMGMAISGTYKAFGEEA